MNKKEIYDLFKKSKLEKSFLNPKVDLAFELNNNMISKKDIITKVVFGLTHDIKQVNVLEYDKKGSWLKTRLCLYMFI